MIDQVVKGLTRNGDAQLSHVRVVGLGQFAGAMQLGEEHLFRRTFQCPPAFNLTLKGPQLAIGESAGEADL